MMQGINWFEEVFLSTEIWGYFGPFALVIIGYYIAKEDSNLGILWFVLECLVVAQYLDLVTATPSYWWSIFLLLLGGIFTCVFPLLDRRR
jgi:hypothetical protein